MWLYSIEGRQKKYQLTVLQHDCWNSQDSYRWNLSELGWRPKPLSWFWQQTALSQAGVQQLSEKGGHFLLYLRKWRGELCVWHVDSMFKCWKNVTFVTTMILFMVTNTRILKENREGEWVVAGSEEKVVCGYSSWKNQDGQHATL